MIWKKVSTDTFSLWSMIRDALDPAHESKRVLTKEKVGKKSPSLAIGI